MYTLVRDLVQERAMIQPSLPSEFTEFLSVSILIFQSATFFEDASMASLSIELLSLAICQAEGRDQ